METNYLMKTYKRKITLESGDGCYVYDDSGKKYLDLIGGVATCPLGHANKDIAKVIAEQALKLVNVSNLFYTRPQEMLAKRLCEISGMAHCFFSNSGTEANECSIKLAKKHTGKHHFIVMKNGFHGRTMGSLSATWKEKYKEPFMPLVPGFEFIDFGDIEALKNAINENTAAVILEPIQGEAGVIVPPVGYLKQVETLTKEHGILLIVDEIQTGNGRTGKYFCYQNEGVIPDIVTTAKGLANGLPIGATLSQLNIDFEPGDHGSTFGGNSFCCTVALKTVEIIETLIPQIGEKSQYLVSKLKTIKNINEVDVRGKGLMLAVNVENAEKIAEMSAELGLLVNCVNANTLRLLPPLIISNKDIDLAVEILKKIIEE